MSKQFKALLCCNNSKPYLYQHFSKKFIVSNTYDKDCIWNGKIVAECDFEVEEIGLVEIPDYAGDECHTFVYDVSIYFETKTLNQDKLFKKSCLNWEEMEKYLYSTNGKGYAIHIKNLTIFNKPKELNNYYKIEVVGDMLFTKLLTKSPKNMMRVSINHWDYATYNTDDIRILIPVSPEEMCRIANKEQDILVRKRVLKEMIR